MPTNLSYAKLAEGGLPEWYYAESLELCEKYRREADAVKSPEKSDLIQVSLMDDEITYLAQCIRNAKNDLEMREAIQAMKKLCVQQNHVKIEQKETLEKRQMEYFQIQEDIFERYTREREAINNKLTALLYDKSFSASLIFWGTEGSESAGSALDNSLPTSASAKTTKQKRQIPANRAKITKRRCSTQQQTSYFSYDSDSTLEEHDEAPPRAGPVSAR